MSAYLVHIHAQSHTQSHTRRREGEVVANSPRVEQHTHSISSHGVWLVMTVARLLPVRADSIIDGDMGVIDPRGVPGVLPM